MGDEEGITVIPVDVGALGVISEFEKYADDIAIGMRIHFIGDSKNFATSIVLGC